jgi:hypothetical protein
MNTTSSQPQWSNPSGSQPNNNNNNGMNGNTGAMQDEFFAPLSTLDEPIMETIMRDVRSVGAKLRVVLLPMDRNVRTNMVVVGVVRCGGNEMKLIGYREYR